MSVKTKIKNSLLISSVIFELELCDGKIDKLYYFLMPTARN